MEPASLHPYFHSFHTDNQDPRSGLHHPDRKLRKSVGVDEPKHQYETAIRQYETKMRTI